LYALIGIGRNQQSRVVGPTHKVNRDLQGFADGGVFGLDGVNPDKNGQEQR
jgi:hypothetical protein